MALTPEQIDRLIQQADGRAPKEGSIFRTLVKLTEAEVRKQDDALILQMLEALDATHGWWGDGEWYGPKTPHWHELTSVARSAARARLGEKT